MISVGFFIPGFCDGGAQRQAALLLNALQERGDIEMHLFHRYEGVHFPLLDSRGVTVQRLDAASNFDPRLPLRLARAVHRHGIDIMVSWLLAADVHCAILRRLVPQTAWIMTERNSRYRAWGRAGLRRRLGLGADAIIANSASGKAYWARAGYRREIHVADNILVPPAGPIGAGGDGQGVVYIGRLEPSKNVLTIARAFCILAARHPHLRFEIVGEGSQRGEIEAIIARAEMGHRVGLPGFQPDVGGVLARAAVQVSLSHHEGLPNALMEGIACGKSIVASAIDEHVELLGPRYPYLVEAFTNPLACAAMIERALAGAAGPQALEHANARLARMTPGAVAAFYADVFEGVMRARRKGMAP